MFCNLGIRAGGSEKQSRLSVLPDIGDILFLAVFWLLAIANPQFCFRDGSIGWHLVTGQYILQTGSVPSHDLISYSHPAAPWVAYEWLFDWLLAAVDKVSGISGLLVVVSGLIALVSLLLYKRCRDSGCHFVIATALTIIGAYASAVHWSARPHLFAYFGVLVFTGCLQRYHLRQMSFRSLLVWLVCTMIFWVNLHPSFGLGLVLIAIYAVSEVIKALFQVDAEKRAESFRSSRDLWFALVLVAVASLFNPYVWNLHVYILQYLGQSKILAHTNEYAPPIFNGSLQANCLELIFLAVLLGLVCTRRVPCLPQLLVVLLLGHLALQSVRHVPLFVIAAVPFAAELLSRSKTLRELTGGAVPVPIQAMCDKWQELNHVVDIMERRCRLHLLPSLAVTLLFTCALSGGTLFGQKILHAGFDSESLPTNTLKCIKEHQLLPQRGFNLDNWGGYIKYRLGIPVFIDDRADFYGEPFYLQYAQVSLVQPDWQRVLDKYGIEWVLFPNNSTLVARLKETLEWRLLCQDQAASLFVRKSK